MSKNKVLYCKGMNMEHSESDGDLHDQRWDDRVLNSAFNRAVKTANIEVAKRLAMATNSMHEDIGGSSSQSKKQTKRKKWTPGMPCRAIYIEDGLEYEAFVSTIVTDDECIVKFLGYDNSEQVAISSLKPSLGQDAQQRQIRQALQDGGEESNGSASGTDDVKSERRRSSSTTERVSQHKKASKKKDNQPHTNNFYLPEVPLPDMSKLKNMASMDIPFPMPPPLQLPSRSDLENEDHAVSSMLLAWYMSGYYTGLYQGLKRSKISKRQRD